MKKSENYEDRFLCGLAQEEHEYVINGVKYVVASRFEPFTNKVTPTINERFGRVIVSDSTPLTKQLQDDKMAAEYVCSAAGEED